MLDELSLTDIALVKEISLTFNPGFTAITGETGAGKSALLSGLNLVLGGRADVQQVRDGASYLLAQARFFTNEDDLDGVVVKRRVGADGRSRATLNGALVSVSELHASVGHLVDLCGQHDHQRLLKSTTHRETLDVWIGDQAHQARDAYHEAFIAYKQAQRELDGLYEARALGKEALEQAHYIVSRFQEVNPQEGELEELEQLLERMEFAESLAQGAEDALEEISGDEGASERLTQAVRSLERAGQHDNRLLDFAGTLQDALALIEDSSFELSRYREQVDFNPEKLERAHERYRAINGLIKSFGPRMQDVFTAYEQACDKVAQGEDSPEREEALRHRVAQTLEVLKVAAKTLNQIRKSHARDFSREVNEYLSRLEMGQSQLGVTVDELTFDQWTSESPSTVELLYRPAKHAQYKPLAKIASGGEMSRVMLALKAVLGTKDTVQTLVFDEIDAGVGGQVAQAVGAVLKELASTHQVICVTHLAQVAALADTQMVVDKIESRYEGDLPLTTVRVVEGEERVQELARMLSGSVTPASLEHAKELMTSW